MDRPLSFSASASEDVAVDCHFPVQVQFWFLWAREVLVLAVEQCVSEQDRSVGPLQLISTYVIIH